MARKPIRKSTEEEPSMTAAAVASRAETAPVVEHEDPSAWPPWARRVVTAVLAMHLAAVVFGAMGVPPSSSLQRWLADKFVWHHGLFDQGYAYRYYAEPPPTPVVVATLHKAEGDEEIVRIPNRELAGPPMRRQRQLALANALFASSRASHRHEGGEAQESWLARSYARHLCRTHPGTTSVTLRVQQHLMPTPDRALDLMRETGGPVDLFDDSLFTTPRWIGDFPCDGY